MKIGDTLYLVDSRGILIKRIIHDLKKENPEYTLYLFNGVKNNFYHSLRDTFINPSPERFYNSHCKFFNKSYLVFTDGIAAKKCLADYVIPKLIEAQQDLADDLIDQHNACLKKVQDLEEYIKHLNLQTNG